MATTEIKTSVNVHGQRLSLDGEEWGGGPYYLTTNRAESPVAVTRLPIWASGWHDVFRALRACVEVWDLLGALAPATVNHALVKTLWRAAQRIERAGRPATCWAILAAVQPRTPRPTGSARRRVGRVLTHDVHGQPVIVYGGSGPMGLHGGTIVVGGLR